MTRVDKFFKKSKSTSTTKTSKKNLNVIDDFDFEKFDDIDEKDVLLKINDKYWKNCDKNDKCSMFLKKRLRAAMIETKSTQNHILIKVVCFCYAMYLSDSDLCKMHKRTMMNLFNFASKQSFEIRKIRTIELIKHQRNLNNFVTNDVCKNWFNDDLLIIDNIELTDKK